MSGCPASVIAGFLAVWMYCALELVTRVRFLLESDTIGVVPTRHVGQDDGVSFMQPFNHLDRIHRGSADLYWHTQSPLSVGAKLKQTNGTVLLPECRTPDIQHVVHPLQVDGSVYTQVRPCALRQFAS